MRLSNVLMGLGVASLGVFIGCSSDTTPSNTTGGGNNSGGAACAVTAAGCKTDISECVSLVDNKDAKKFGLRISQLVIETPAQLASGIVASVVNTAVSSNYAACTLGSESVYGSGTGLFSWLIEFDLDKGTLTTGGANPVADPTAGYCFINGKIGSNEVAPFTVDAKVGTDGSFAIADGKNLTVPIFLTPDAKNVVLLPLNKARLFDAKLSADHNCIGKYNAEGLDPVNNCKQDPESGIYTFEPGGKLEGFITLDEADGVEIESLGKESLCVLLSGKDDGATPKRCPKGADGKISVKGDFCSTTNSAGGCQDSFRLAAKFAANGVKINGSCN